MSDDEIESLEADLSEITKFLQAENEKAYARGFADGQSTDKVVT